MCSSSFNSQTNSNWNLENEIINSIKVNSQLKQYFSILEPQRFQYFRGLSWCKICAVQRFSYEKSIHRQKTEKLFFPKELAVFKEFTYWGLANISIKPLLFFIYFSAAFFQDNHQSFDGCHCSCQLWFWFEQMFKCLRHICTQIGRTRWFCS